MLQVEQPAELDSIAFSPDGTRLATGGEEEVVRVFDAADGREHAALFTGCHAGQRPGVQPRWPPALRRRLGDGRDQGPRPGPRSARPARSELWPGQIAALTFDREGLRVLGIDWRNGVLWSADPVDGTRWSESSLPVTNSRRWPRGDFAFSRDGRRLAAPDATGPDGRRGLGRRPRAAGRHAAGIGRAGHGRRVRPRRPVAGDRGGSAGRRGGRS